MSEANDFKRIVNELNQKSPLVHNITNYVVMNNTANALLAIGASPVMAHAIEEVEDFVSISSSLVINMGTLSERWVEGMILAITKAKELNTPVVFDPVGVGATKFRTETAQKIIEAGKPTVIRGNASEIMALAQSASNTKGVDSTMDSGDAVTAARHLSAALNNTIVISGATDYIITRDQISKVTDGSAMMAKVTGMGCTATCLIGACTAVEPDPHLASTVAMQMMGKAGNKAESLSTGPGSFQMNFLDSLYNLKEVE